MQPFFCARVEQAEHIGVKAKAVGGVGGVSVFNVPAYGVPYVLHMDSDLVFPAGFKLEFNEGVFAV